VAQILEVERGVVRKAQNLKDLLVKIPENNQRD
jgi:hypothetical protein